jgi:hypothetical protein
MEFILKETVLDIILITSYLSNLKRKKLKIDLISIIEESRAVSFKMNSIQSIVIFQNFLHFVLGISVR